MATAGADLYKNILLLALGIFIFLIPFAFGLPAGCFNHILPQEVWQIFVIGIFALWMLAGAGIGRIRVRYSAADTAVAVFLVSAVVSLLNAPQTHIAHQCLAQYICYALLYFLILNLLREKTGFLLWIVVSSAVIISLYGIYQHYIGFSRTKAFAAGHLNRDMFGIVKGRLDSGRIFGTFIYPNIMAGYLLLVLPVKWRNVPVSSIILYALFLTFSKGAYIILAIFLAFCAYRYIKGIASYVLAAGLALLFIAVFFLSADTLGRRAEYWCAGAEMFGRHPLAGAGTGNFGLMYPLYKPETAEETRYAHNSFLQILAEQGIPGLVSFCFIWGIVIKKGISFQGGISLSAGLILWLVHNMGEFDWYVPGSAVAAWVFAALLVKKSGYYREKIFYIKNGRQRGLYILCVLLLFVAAFLYLGKNAAAKYYLAAAEREDTDARQRLARAAAYLDKDNPEAYSLLARADAAAGNYKGSILRYKKALRYNPYSSLYYYNMGQVYMYMMHKTDNASLLADAGFAFKKAVEYYPACPFYRFCLAQFYEFTGQDTSAVLEYSRCLKLNNRLKAEYRKRGKMLKHLMLGVNEEREAEAAVLRESGYAGGK